jgi:hypothetical protein
MWEEEDEGAQGGTEGHEDDDNGTPDGGSSSGTQGGQESLSTEAARKLRSEARNLRSRLKEAEKERDDLKASQMSELEKLQKGTEDLSKSNATLVQENRSLRAQVVAGRVGIVDPEIAVGLVDWDDAEDDASLEKQFKAILKAKPYLAGNVAGGADGGARGQNDGGGASEDMNTLLRRKAGVVT